MADNAMDKTSCSHDISKILAELHSPYNVLPREAILAAREVKNEIIPGLIQILRNAIEEIQNDVIPDNMGHCCALYLLSEFKAYEAFPVVLEAFSLYGDGPFDLFGDDVTENLKGILARLGDNNIDLIDALTFDLDVIDYVRMAACQSYLYLLRDGHLTREQTIEKLRKCLQYYIANDLTDEVSFVVCDLTDLRAVAALPEIELAFQRDQIEPMIIDWKSVQREIQLEIPSYQKKLSELGPTGIVDAIAEFEKWPAFQPQDRKPKSIRKLDAKPDLAISSLHRDTIVSETSKVGRNDPCSCGSGKKFKKCCGAS